MPTNYIYKEAVRKVVPTTKYKKRIKKSGGELVFLSSFGVKDL